MATHTDTVQMDGILKRAAFWLSFKTYKKSLPTLYLLMLDLVEIVQKLRQENIELRMRIASMKPTTEPIEDGSTYEVGHG